MKTFNITLSTTEKFWNFEIFEILFLKTTPKYQDIYGHTLNCNLLLKALKTMCGMFSFTQ